MSITSSRRLCLAVASLLAFAACSGESNGGTNSSGAGAPAVTGGSGSSGATGRSGDGGTSIGGGSAGRGALGGTEAEQGAGSAGEEQAMNAGAAGADALGPLRVEDAMSDYGSWTQLMDQPASISAEIANLCRSLTVPEMQFSMSDHGKDRLLLYWGNAEAAPGFMAKDVPFPVGAAIVKEKFSPSGSGMMLVGKGAMIKRAPGFDPAHGDWEFAYWEASSGILAGAAEAESCGNCHAGAAATDFVFLDQSWRTP